MHNESEGMDEQLSKNNLFRHIYHYYDFNARENGACKILTVKTVAKNIVKSLNVPVVKQLQAFTPLQHIRLQEGIVIKPSFEANSAGVFLVKSHHEITDLYAGKTLHSFEALQKAAATYLLNKTVRSDKWNVEELITGMNNSLPPHEIKFFCFYDTIGMVLERKVDIDNHPYDYRRTFYDEHRSILYSDQLNTSLIEPSFPEWYYDTALHISKHLPVPFIRIDFIRTDKELLFSEFEIKPGTFRYLPDALRIQTTDRLGVFLKRQSSNYQRVFPIATSYLKKI